MLCVVLSEGFPFSASGMNPSSDANRPYCWECLRRRLECDSTRPVCDKCRQAGIVCPGYEDKKPLRWLAPGRVTSRNRKPKTITAKKGKKNKGQEDTVLSLPSQTTVDFEQLVPKLAELYSGFLIPVIHLRDDVSDAVQSVHYCKSILILGTPLPVLSANLKVPWQLIHVSTQL